MLFVNVEVLPQQIAGEKGVENLGVDVKLGSVGQDKVTARKPSKLSMVSILTEGAVDGTLIQSVQIGKKLCFF